MTVYDYLIIGSGFGGSVSALRLAEKGWKVGILEQGRRIRSEDIRRAKQSPLRKFVWNPALGKAGRQGYSAQHIFRHVGILGGVGLGGGSLVWGAVMLPPKDSFYDAKVWQKLGIDMHAELTPHLAAAQRMLGVVPNPRKGRQDQFLKATAEHMNVGATWGTVPQAIFFGSDAEKGGQTVDDPFFNGQGPKRASCRFCGECLAGCEYGSKNSLDHNYLYLAEKRGVDIHTQTQALRIQPLTQGGYQVKARTENDTEVFQCKNLILAAGVIGTLELLLRGRDQHGTLPQISQRCGDIVRTNSEALTAILNRNPKENLLTDGAAISSDFYADDKTHITQNRIAPALVSLLRLMFVPMVQANTHLGRIGKTLLSLLTRPRDWLSLMFGRNWSGRITTLTVMQNDDSGVSLKLGRPWYAPWRSKLISSPPARGEQAPSHLPLANAATRAYAEVSNGIALSSSLEVFGNRAMTAHILGGCPIGKDASDSVIGPNHEVHGYPGLFVVDGAAIPANLGVNPSLTITAMAERFASLQPTSRNQGVT